MKDKGSYIKRVYRQSTSTNKKGYWFNPEHTLGGDFYPVSVVANFSNGRFKVEYYDMFLRTLVIAWKDKHGNVVVRYMNQFNKQTKIDF